MKNKILVALCFMIPVVADAAIPYRVEQIELPTTVENDDSKTYAEEYRYYLGGAYNFYMWQDAISDNFFADGKTSSGFEAFVGMRLYDTFRIELNYMNLKPEWEGFSLSSNAAFVNAIFDARIDNMYSLFYNQMLVPYIGIGAGAVWNSATGIEIDKKLSPAMGFLAGVAVEFNNWFAIDFGYKYFYMLSPDFNKSYDFKPVSHMLRAGIRFSF